VSEAPRRRIVVVSYYWPPLPSIGAQRWVSMSRHLRAAGHDVRVITSAAHGSLPDDGSRIVRTGDLASAGSLRTLLRRPALDAAGSATPQTPAPALLTRVVVPDSYLVSWMPTALAAVRRLTRAGAVDCVVTSGPPDSTHLIGLLLGRRRPTWIADFRDGWRFEPMRPEWPTGIQDRLEASLERRVARGADVALGATLPIAEDLAARLGADAHWVTNGFEPELAAAAGRQPPDNGDGWRTLAHTGTLSGFSWGRDPRPMLAAVREFNASRVAGQPRVRLLLAGRPSVDDQRLIADAELGEAVEHRGLVTREQSLAIQRGADALLLVTGRNRSEATGKLFEYLASGRPIVALAKENEAARIVRDTGTGVAVGGGDPAGLRAALEALADGGLERGYAPQGLERFRYPGPADAVAELIERALARRAAN
jgi:glycosyltransferase involved in cell wall biosynthesis